MISPKIQKKSLLSVAVGLILSVDAIASNGVSETVVTGTKTEVALEDSLASVAVFTAEDIERLQVVDLPALLQRVSGVAVTSSGGRGSVANLSIRGTDSDQAVVLVDGVRTASATTGATALSRIPLSSIEKIEIVKGPLSSLYGADAMGGVIQVFTKRGSEGFGGSIEAVAGNYETQKAGGDVHWGEGGFTARLGLYHEAQRGFDRTDDSINTDNDKYTELSGTASAQYVTEEWLLQGSYLWNSGEVHYDNTSGPDNNHYSETQFENLSLSSSYSPSADFRLKATAGYFVDDSDNPAYESRIKTQRDMAGLQADVTLREGVIVTLGTDYYNDRVSGVTGRHWLTEEFETYDENSRDNLAGFAQLQGRASWFSSVVSLRYDDNEAYGDSTTGNVAIELPVGEIFSIVQSYGTAFNAPTFNQLYWPGYGDKTLLPQESESFELAFKGNFSTVQATLSIFSTDVDNQIVTDVQGGAKNIDAAEFDGRELDVSWSGDVLTLSAQLSSVTSVDAQTGKQLKDRPELFGSLYGHWQVESSSALSITLRGESGRTDAYYDSDIGGNVYELLPGFMTLDFGFHYVPVDTVNLRWQINNLLDKEYVTNFASKTANYRNYGINGTFSVEYQF